MIAIHPLYGFHFNPLPPHGGRHVLVCAAGCGIHISIHSLRMEGDAAYSRPYRFLIAISIHSLRMEGDLFQVPPVPEPLNFNPLPPHGGRHFLFFISCKKIRFQSTPSAWRETHLVKVSLYGRLISIHSLRMEGDYDTSRTTQHFFHFNPLPPHGGRQIPDAAGNTAGYFNPLPPHGGRRKSYRGQAERNHFNPLPPHGGRQTWNCYSEKGKKFQSTPSAWRETGYATEVQPPEPFQSTPSAWRETRRRGAQRAGERISIHSLRMEGDLFKAPNMYYIESISIHSLRMEGDSKTAQESVFHFAYPCTILQKRMQKTTFCTRKNGFFRKKGEKFGAKPSASFCAPMIRTDTFPLNFSHRISGSSMSMVSFAPICSTFD